MPLQPPSNVRISSHPCLQSKLSQLRSDTASTRETRSLVKEITSILAVEATAHLEAVTGPSEATTPIGCKYTTTGLAVPSVSIVPILRSGLGMVEALESVLPTPVPTHHLGLFREPTTLAPVEYYNNLPHHVPPSASHTVFILDPVIATGGTCVAAIQTLREWGVQQIVVISILGAKEGVRKAASEWPEGVTIWLAGVDEGTNDKGMIVPGIGDVGDRLFLTIGK